MKKLLPLLCITAGLFACDTESFNQIGSKTKARKDIVLTRAEQQIVQRNQAFTFDFFRAVSSVQGTDGNMLISPLSATLALAMLNNGAAGATHSEIQTALGYGDITRDEMNGFFRKMLGAMDDLDNQVIFKSANSMWLQKDFPVLSGFKKTNQDYYDAEVKNVDFSKSSTVNAINKWCSDKTRGKIPTILDRTSPEDRFYLINALYFKGLWKKPFQKALTVDLPFYNQNGTVPRVPTMAAERWMVFYGHEDFGMVELPYGNEAFSMLILLPDEDKNVDDILAMLDGDLWAETMAGVGGWNVQLKLPRFKGEYEQDLKQVFYDMGMRSMFVLDADFTLINATAPLYINTALQKTFIQVDEEGTEAAAVTVVGGLTSPGPADPNETIVFTVDRPFLYFIKEKSTGTILFMGRINNLEG